MINSNVYLNVATEVRSLFERSVTFLPAPRWNVTFAHGWQDGGGLYIWGTATLTNTNVYANQADTVCSPFELSSSAPMESLTLLSLLAGWWPRHLWDSKYGWLQRLQ